MHPDLFTIPGTAIKLHSYGLMIMLGFVGAVWLMGRHAAKAGTNKDTLIDMGIFAMVIGILSAKVNYVLQYPEGYAGSWAPFDFSDGNLSVLGAVILAPLPYAAWLWKTRKTKAPMRGATFAVVAVLTVVCAAAGARGYYLLTHAEEYRGKWKFLEDWRSGFVLYGGLIGGVLAGMAFVKWKKLSILSVGDIAAPGIALGVGIGRVGCFLQGCCWGTDKHVVPWMVRFPRESSFFGYLREKGQIDFDATHTPAVHPTQLYEFLACLLIVGILLFLLKRRRHYGEVLAMLGITYSAWRFGLEMLRTDPRPTYWKWTYSQWAGVVVFVLCSLALFYIKKHGRKVEREAAATPA